MVRRNIAKISDCFRSARRDSLRSRFDLYSRRCSAHPFVVSSFFTFGLTNSAAVSIPRPAPTLAAEPTQMYYVLYGFDALIKPYMRLVSSDTYTQRINTYTVGSQIKILIEASLPDDLQLFDVDFDVVVYNDDKKDKKKDYTKKDCILTDEMDYVVLIDSDELGVGTYMVKLTVYIPDTDFPDGKRKEVIRINPNVKVTG